MALPSRTRVVRLLKVVLPLLALALLSAMFLLPNEQRLPGGIVISTADLVKLGEGLRVTAPRLTGQTDAGEPFSIRAEYAEPDKPNPDRITLEKVAGDVETVDGVTIRLDAGSGEVVRSEDIVRLKDGVTVTTSDGYRVETELAEANTRELTLAAPGPVRASGPMGRIEAGSMRAERRETGDFVWFENRVKVVYRPAAAGRDDAGNAPESAKGGE